MSRTMLSITARLQNRGASDGSSATLTTGILHFAGAALAAGIVLCGLLRPKKGIEFEKSLSPQRRQIFMIWFFTASTGEGKRKNKEDKRSKGEG
jgi:hypothetical protein